MRLRFMFLTCVGLVIPALASAQAAPVAAVKIEWVRIPAGTFEMGCVPADSRCGTDEHPRHSVTISKAFEMMQTEVTVGMYRAPGREPDPQPIWSTSPDHPLVIVEWEEAKAFCAAIGGRLPTEAEWEYAARGGRADTIYPWGNEPPVDRVGAAGGAAFESDSAQPAGSFGANGFGLRDMIGNVWEWVADFGGFYAAGTFVDPTGQPTGRVRIVRGGSYGDDPVTLRISNRTPADPDRGNINVGFRCARDL
jgi:formylglycine-generating enzyme required for sulfatase activity